MAFLIPGVGIFQAPTTGGQFLIPGAGIVEVESTETTTHSGYAVARSGLKEVVYEVLFSSVT